MKTLKFLLIALLALNMGMACSKNESSVENPLTGKWKVIEENNPWNPDLIQPVDYYSVWEFFPDGTFKRYHTIDNMDDQLRTYELKSDSLYTYYENIKEECCTHIYRCQFIDKEKNKIKIEYLQGNITAIPQPLLWIYERVNK
jgi:hypothetical protein